jgi:hypothetical protein
MTRLARALAWCSGTVLVFCVACDGPPAHEAAKATRPVAVTVAVPGVGERATSVVAVATVTAAVAAPSAVAPSPSKLAPAQASSVQVKRFVVATGVKDREPLTTGDALLADGTAIYAFAELANKMCASPSSARAARSAWAT